MIRMVKRFFIVWMLLSVFCPCLFAQYDMNAPLSLDPNTRVGKLANGLTYYIRYHKEPRERANFYIIQNVGAILEEDDQNGLAHFLEHMAFNGTKHFPGRKGITDMLEKRGVQFGRNVNAYTAQDETVYLINDVPTKNPGLLDTCLLVLHDWSHYLTLVDEEIDGERGIIAEEWRTRRNPDFRTRAKVMPVLLNGSKYAKRDVIGDLNVIKNFKYQTLRDYYHKWYRPDLQAIAVVGDFDVDQMEQKVKDLFSRIPAAENPAPRKEYLVEPHDDVKFVCATDNELTKSSVTVFIKRPATTREQKNTHQYLKDFVVTSLYNMMLEQRIKESIQAGTADFVEGHIVVSTRLTRSVEAFILEVTPKPNEEAKALEALWRESERVRRFGFTPTELERGKRNAKMMFDFFYNQKDKAPANYYIQGMQQHFLTGEPLLDVDYQYNFVKTMLETITEEDFIEMAKKCITSKNMVIAVQGPENAKHITREEAIAVIEKVNDSKIDPYMDEVVDKPLLDEKLEGGKIVKTKKLQQFDAEEWTLENGAKVVFRKVDYQKDEVSVTSYSKGGTSLYDLDKLPSAKMVNSFMKYFGLGDHDANTLAKILSGKRTSAAATIGEFSESVNGSTSPEHFETLMQLIYMRFEKPRFNKAAYDVAMERERAAIANIDNNPKNAMMDSILLNLNDYHQRVMPYSLKFLDKVNFEDIEAVYRDRIKDISDFTFFIVGNIDAETVKPLVEKYLGSVKSFNRKENWVDRGVRGPQGRVEKVIELGMQEPKATVLTRINKGMKLSTRDGLCLSILKSILNNRYMENVREKEGGTYGVSVQSSAAKIPYASCGLNIAFDCDPAKAEYLKLLIFSELELVAKEAPTEDEVKNVVGIMKKNREQAKPNNGYWMNAIRTYYIDGRDVTATKDFGKVIGKITPKDIQKFAKKLFTGADVVDLMFVPRGN